MIQEAYRLRASDIHIEPHPRRGDAVVRFRIDGVCRPYERIPRPYVRAVVSRIKIMAELDISERRLPQDGKILMRRYGPLELEVRVATLPTVGQEEDVVLRLLPTGKPLRLSEMGMAPWTYEHFLRIISRPHGLVLVVGPTGSGKTTTLHAVLGHINRPETKIWTVEDPVEIIQEGIRQVQVAPKIGLDFPRAMRAFLRADPDVIMVGEMRDQETASMAIEASLTGHLVLSTLHTNSAPETVVRLLEMGMDPLILSDVLLGVLAQRLVRNLCPHCKDPYHPPAEDLQAILASYHAPPLPPDAQEPPLLFQARGCPHCGRTGYRGRTGIHELLPCSEGVRDLIRTRAPLHTLREEARRQGMITLWEDGIRKVLSGITDLAELRRVCMV